jgi:hypothetical protein
VPLPDAIWWQLTTSLSQIGEHELVAGVGDTKPLKVRALIGALRCSPEAVDRWIDTTTGMFPDLKMAHPASLSSILSAVGVASD